MNDDSNTLPPPPAGYKWMQKETTNEYLLHYYAIPYLQKIYAVELLGENLDRDLYIFDSGGRMIANPQVCINPDGTVHKIGAYKIEGNKHNCEGIRWSNNPMSVWETANKLTYE